MDADDQHFFVIRAVENSDVAALREAFGGPPQVIVIQVFWRGRLEGIDLAALRIHSRHYVLDGAVFSSSVHGLKNQEDAATILSIELVLIVGHFDDALCEELFGLRLGMNVSGGGRVEVF